VIDPNAIDLKKLDGRNTADTLIAENAFLRNVWLLAKRRFVDGDKEAEGPLLAAIQEFERYQENRPKRR